MAEKVYQIQGDLVHFGCLTDSTRETIEMTGREVLLKDLEEDDICFVCGESANLNGADTDEEPSELEKDDDN